MAIVPARRYGLRGKLGDKINAISMAIGFNLRKILRTVFLWTFEILLFASRQRKFNAKKAFSRTD